MSSILFQNARIVDGSGQEPYVGDVLINGDKISSVGKAVGQADQIIDATGLYLAPGFIDSHSHGDQALGTKWNAYSRLCQGITTEVVGQCGISLFPLPKGVLAGYSNVLGMEQLPSDEAVSSFAAYAEYTKNLPLFLNEMFLTGHGCLRTSAMGFENREPTSGELEHMKALLRETLEHGSVGLSSGLVYVPGCYSHTAEMIELCKVVKEYGGIYATHMRNESKDILRSVQEALEVAGQTGVQLVISHIKVMGIANWGLADQILKLVHHAIDEGVNVSMDQYPYNETCSGLDICVPPWHKTKGGAGLAEKLKDHEQRTLIRREMEDPTTSYENNYINSGGFDGIFITMAPGCPQAEGKTLAQYAGEVNKNGFDAYFDLLIQTLGSGFALYSCIGNEDMFRFILDERVVVGTDGVVLGPHTLAHPRTFGTFPRAINLFVKEQKLFPIETMIHKMTGQTAQIWKLPTKGLIRKGMDADLVLFNLSQVRDGDRCIFDASSEQNEGIRQVYVGGRLAFDGGRLTGETAGRLILCR